MSGGRSNNSSGSSRGKTSSGNPIVGNRNERMQKLPVFQFDEFKSMAYQTKIMQLYSGDKLQQYKDALLDIEDGIKKKNIRLYERGVKSLKLLLDKSQDLKIKKLKSKFDEMNGLVDKMKTRGGDYFQCIHINEITPEVVAAPVTPKAKKNATTNQETNVLERLLKIEEMCEGSTTGAKPKAENKRPMDDVITAIEKWCKSAKEERQKAVELSDIHVKVQEKSKLQVVVGWTKTLEKQMKEASHIDDEFKPTLSADDDLNAIRVVMQRVLRDTKEREDKWKTLEEKNIVLVKQMMSLISEEDNAVTKGKKPNEKKDVNQLMTITLSKLNTQIDHLNNQGLRLEALIKSTNESNGKLVTETKKTTNKKQQDKPSKGLAAIFETHLSNLERECTRCETVVNQVDTEIETLEKELENWPEVKEKVKDMDKFEKCSIKAVRFARLKLEQLKMDNCKNSKQDNMKSVTQSIAKLCMDNDIDVSKKKDDYVYMIKQLGVRMNTDQKSLKTLEKELKELQDADEKKGKDATTSKNNTEIKSLIELAQNAKTYLHTLKQELTSKQHKMNGLTQAISKLCIDNDIGVSKMEDEYVDTIKQLGVRLKKEQQCSRDMKDLENDLHLLDTYVHGFHDDQEDSIVSFSQNPLPVIRTVDNIHKELKKSKHLYLQLIRRVQDSDATLNRFTDGIEPHLDSVINMLTNKPPTSQHHLPELPSRLTSVFVKVVFVESVSEQCLQSLHNAYSIIIRKQLRLPAKANKGGAKHPELNIDGFIQILVDDAISAGITCESVSQLTHENDDYKHREKRLKQAVSEWKAVAEKEAEEKEEYMTRLSKVASAKLTNNNPNIADLSDPNRQTKLAEEYSQLYDNEWTNAFEDLQSVRPDESEETRIQCLLQMLMTVYNKCVDLRSQQLTGMRMALLQPANFFCLLNNEQDVSPSDETEKENKKKGGTMPKVKTNPAKSPKTLQSKSTAGATNQDSEVDSLGAIQSQAITDLGKQTYTQALQDITKYFQRSQIEWFNGGNLEVYTTKCIEICWLMNIHSPPVCLDASFKKGDVFDKTKYREYTARGKKVKFVVWPIILLHTDGATLGKGVAQGMN